MFKGNLPQGLQQTCGPVGYITMRNFKESRPLRRKCGTYLEQEKTNISIHTDSFLNKLCNYILKVIRRL
jgi:hypothetical protein